MANAVFAIRDDKIFAGIVTSGCGNTGIAGKLSLAIPTILYVFRSARICTQWFSSSLKRISPSGSKRTSSRSFFAGIVPEPSFFIFASQEVRMESSRSVAVSVILLPEASHRMLPRIGIVVFRSTTPCVRLNSWSRSNFFTLNSIAGFPPRKALTELRLRRVTVPCFRECIKIVVVAVAVEMRKSRSHDGTEAVEPVHAKLFWPRIVRINSAKCPRQHLFGIIIHSAIESCTGDAWSFAQDIDRAKRRANRAPSQHCRARSSID